MDKNQVVAILEEIGLLLEFKGENPFKVRAYQNAAKAIESQSVEPAELASSGLLLSIKGVGEAISLKINELVSTGRLNYLDDLRSSIPAGLMSLFLVPGLGPRKVRILHERIGIQSLYDLEQACLQNQLLSLEGFGKKTQERILQGIQFLNKYQGIYLVSFAREQALGVVTALKSQPDLLHVSLAGSLRRQKGIVSNIDLVASAGNEGSLMESFIHLPEAECVVARGETESIIQLKSGIQVDLRLVPDAQFPFALRHFTGSRHHNVAMGNRVRSLGLQMSESGLLRGGGLIYCEDENRIFEECGLAFIPPELREGSGEIEAAEAGRLPKLLEAEDLCGIFHVHTSYSDGRSDLRSMIRAAADLGYQYVGISDHSQSASYAHGLKAEDIQRQHAEIDQLNVEFRPFRIFKGIESDVLADGALDYPTELLRSFDFVIASVHSRFNLSTVQMTERICAAIRNPFVTMLAHPTGRLLLSREPYLVDLDTVIQTAVAQKVIIEINSHPSRLDLDWRVLKSAKARGLLTSINPDAHSVNGYRDISYGVGIARKGWLEARDVFNAWPLQEVVSYLESKRSGTRIIS